MVHTAELYLLNFTSRCLNPLDRTWIQILNYIKLLVFKFVINEFPPRMNSVNSRWAKTYTSTLCTTYYHELVRNKYVRKHKWTPLSRYFSITRASRSSPHVLRSQHTQISSIRSMRHRVRGKSLSCPRFHVLSFFQFRDGARWQEARGDSAVLVIVSKWRAAAVAPLPFDSDSGRAFSSRKKLNETAGFIENDTIINAPRLRNDVAPLWRYVDHPNSCSVILLFFNLISLINILELEEGRFSGKFSKVSSLFVSKGFVLLTLENLFIYTCG